MASDILQFIVFGVALVLLAWPLGPYMAKVFAGERTPLATVFGPVERVLHRAARVDTGNGPQSQSWGHYAFALLAFNEWSSVPILILSVRDGETEKVAALDGGANDYVVKPFGVAELLARVRALLRSSIPDVAPEPSEWTVGDLTVDVARHDVRQRGAVVRVTRKEFDLLRLLARHAGRIVTHQQLLRGVWGKAHEHDTQYLRVFIGQRHKLGDDPANPTYILNEPGVGHRLLEPAEAGPATDR